MVMQKQRFNEEAMFPKRLQKAAYMLAEGTEAAGIEPGPLQFKSGEQMPQNLVLWFMKTIEEFGGKYEPFRDLEPAKKHTSGRRESRIEPRILSVQEYRFDDHGSVRRIA